MSLVESVRSGLARGVAVGGWQHVPSPLVSEAMASLGFSWIALDLEHATVDPNQAEACFAAMEKHGCAPFVRLPSHDPYLARRLLDAGVQGLIVPVAQDPVEFDAFARHLFYPPHGRRGVGLSRCNLWGDRFETYLSSFRPMVVPQIETRRGIERLPEIAALPYVETLFLGPYDLSADLGIAGKFDEPVFVKAADTFMKECVQSGKVPGYHVVQPDPQQLRARAAEGFRFLAYGTDVIAMRSALGRPGMIIEDKK